MTERGERATGVRDGWAGRARPAGQAQAAADASPPPPQHPDAPRTAHRDGRDGRARRGGRRPPAPKGWPGRGATPARRSRCVRGRRSRTPTRRRSRRAGSQWGCPARAGPPGHLAARPRQGGDGHAAARTGRLRTGATPGAAPVPRVAQTSPAATSPPRRSRAGREYLLYPRRCAQPWTGARCRWRRVHSPRWEAAEARVAAPSRAGRPRLRWAALASSPAAG